MADRRISELTAATSVAGADISMIVQGGTNKKLTFANLFNSINTPVIINSVSADQDTIIRGDTDANLVFVDASTDRVGFGTATPSEKIDVAGGIALNGVVNNASVDTQSAAGAVSLTTDTTVISSADSIAITLGVPSKVGQSKTIVSSSTGTITLTATNSIGFVSIVFESVGETVTLKYIAGGWYVMTGFGVTIETGVAPA